MQDEHAAQADAAADGAADGSAHDPYDDFSVDEEPMPDGRTIRYYEWPPGIDEEAKPDV